MACVCYKVMVPCGPDGDNVGFKGLPPICTFETIESVEGQGVLESHVIESQMVEDGIGRLPPEGKPNSYAVLCPLEADSS